MYSWRNLGKRIIAITGQSVPALKVYSQRPISWTLLPPDRTRSRAHSDDPC
jgi:hypothetical protein